MWLAGDAIAEIDRLIELHRADHAAWRQHYANAKQVEQRAQEQLDAARAQMVRALLEMTEDDLEIDRLLDERLQIPKQRGPVD